MNLKEKLNTKMNVGHLFSIILSPQLSKARSVVKECYSGDNDRACKGGHNNSYFCQTYPLQLWGVLWGASPQTVPLRFNQGAENLASPCTEC